MNCNKIANMHRRRSEDLQLAIQECLDVDWSNVKYYIKRQLSKCVNECKSQASNAKRIVGTIRVRRSRNRAAEVPNADYDSTEEYDYWDSDFDEDFDDDDDEVNEGQNSEVTSIENSFTEGESIIVNNNCIQNESKGEMETVEENTTITTTTTCSSKFIPKPPDEPIIPSCMLSNSAKPLMRNNISRPPIKRPPSQPPPPPVPQLTSQNGQNGHGEEPLEDYEIPINHQPNFLLTAALIPAASMPEAISLSILQNNNDNETYEIVQPDEDYEVVDNPAVTLKPIDKPVVPPRIPALVTRGSPPPPLPQKPKKFKDISSVQHKMDSYRSLDRPKLPIRVEEENSHETNTSPVVSAISSTILNSLLGRRNSSPSPRSAQSLNDGGVLNINNQSFDNQSSRSSSPEKDGLFVVGSSTFINSATASETKSPPQLPAKSSTIMTEGYFGSNMATRPLPPVPQDVKTEEKASTSETMHPDLSKYSWFHEVEREVAEEKVKTVGTHGAFLVRPSKRAGEDNPYTVTLFYGGRVFHLNVRLRPDNTFALGKEKEKESTFTTVAELINHHQKNEILLISRGESAGRTLLCTSPGK